MAEAFDYIIVGAGSAGCVLAHRLSADPAVRVLLLEAGGAYDSPLIAIPKGFSKAMSQPGGCWAYRTEHCGEDGYVADQVWTRGRGLGGSSAINGMVYVRGQPQDYEAWAAVAGSDWGWPAMKAAFRAIEDHALGDDGVRGVGGPLHVSPVPFRYPLTERLIQAGVQMGLPRREDLNGEDQEGVGFYSQTVKRGVRQSAAVAFLDPVRNRANLTIETDVHVDRVAFEGRRASGVEGRRRGRPVTFACRGEVLVAGGTMSSPKLLQLSGVGPVALLRQAGVPVVHDSPNVGEGMREHLGLTVTRALVGDRGINHRFHGLHLGLSALQYVLFRSGPLATGPWEVGAFARSDPSKSRPDFQLLLGGMTLAAGRRGTTTGDRPAMTIYGMLNQLESEGRVRIVDPDPDAPPAVSQDWLCTDHDRRAAIGMFRFIRRWYEQPALVPVLGEEIMPGAQVQTYEAILAAYRRFALCGLHAVRTCRMGRDPGSVVDERLRVRGVTGLRVVDCSVMPGLISGNTNGPAMALAWRAADLIVADAREQPARAA